MMVVANTARDSQAEAIPAAAVVTLGAVTGKNRFMDEKRPAD
jgi:hypothetical protein